MRRGLCRFPQAGNSLCEYVLETNLTDSWWERSRGLLALSGLKSNEALWISPCNSVHTFGMTYSLDLIYLNRSLQIIKLIEQCVPRRISWCWNAKSVLEVPAGTINRLNLQKGMSMVWEKTVIDQKKH